MLSTGNLWQELYIALISSYITYKYSEEWYLKLFFYAIFMMTNTTDVLIRLG